MNQVLDVIHGKREPCTRVLWIDEAIHDNPAAVIWLQLVRVICVRLQLGQEGQSLVRRRHFL
jgi:hypothetical protein